MSLKLGRFFGISVFVHWSFWLLPLWIVLYHRFDPDAAPLGMQLTLLGSVFACVVLHEYGHALTARRFGIRTQDITLYPIGGVARLDRMSERPWEEFFIAVAGPLVNVAIAIVLGTVTAAGSLFVPGFLDHPVGTYLFILTALNVLLVVFNLLPAFPMDGGRVLRSLLAVPLGTLRATRVAVAVGTVMAMLYGLVGLFVLHSPWLALIGLFIFWAGQQELWGLEARERRRRAWEDEEPIVVDLVDDPEPAWRPVPKPVTVYVWDAVRNEWIKQGTVSAAR
jgi:Zn-dependent protease